MTSDRGCEWISDTPAKALKHEPSHAVEQTMMGGEQRELDPVGRA